MSGVFWQSNAVTFLENVPVPFYSIQKVWKSLELFLLLNSICYIIAVECYIDVATKHILCRTVLAGLSYQHSSSTHDPAYKCKRHLT